MRNSFKTIISICTLLVSIPATLYFWQFHGPLSKDPDRWAAFGDYLNPFIALLNVVVFIYLTFVIKEFEDKREQKRLLLPKMLEAERELVRIEYMANAMVHSWPVTPKGSVQELAASAIAFKQEYLSVLSRAKIDVTPLKVALMGVELIEYEVDEPYGNTERVTEHTEKHLETIIEAVADFKKMVIAYLAP
jgi:hypothetical protein